MKKGNFCVPPIIFTLDSLLALSRLITSLLLFRLRAREINISKCNSIQELPYVVLIEGYEYKILFYIREKNREN